MQSDILRLNFQRNRRDFFFFFLRWTGKVRKARVSFMRRAQNTDTACYLTAFAIPNCPPSPSPPPSSLPFSAGCRMWRVPRVWQWKAGGPLLWGVRFLLCFPLYQNCVMSNLFRAGFYREFLRIHRVGFVCLFVFRLPRKRHIQNIRTFKISECLLM